MAIFCLTVNKHNRKIFYFLYFRCLFHFFKCLLKMKYNVKSALCDVTNGAVPVTSLFNVNYVLWDLLPVVLHSKHVATEHQR